MGKNAQALVASWHLITGEYPPQPGGVSDYAQQLAQALSDSGKHIHVWAPGSEKVRFDGAVTVHGLSGFGLEGLRALSAGLKAVTGRRRLLLQYVASTYGFRGLNLPFALWLASWGADEVWVQFHEVAFGFAWGQRPQRNLLAAGEWWMAQLIAGRAQRIFVSVPGWRRQLGRYAERAEVLPIPSNLPTGVNSAEVNRVRARLGADPLIGHFGTYSPLVADLLEPVVVSILGTLGDARFLLIGRGGMEFAGRLASTYPEIATRLIAPGSLDPVRVATHLAACDVGVQPYPDGISGRRTTAMAWLALGKPIVTTSGILTESDWGKSGAVVLVPVRRIGELPGAVCRLLSAKSERECLGARAHGWYQQRFSIERTLEVLGDSNASARLEP